MRSTRSCALALPRYPFGVGGARAGWAGWAGGHVRTAAQPRPASGVAQAADGRGLADTTMKEGRKKDEKRENANMTRWRDRRFRHKRGSDT
jgi:hypothetical protein